MLTNFSLRKEFKYGYRKSNSENGWGGGSYALLGCLWAGSAGATGNTFTSTLTKVFDEPVSSHVMSPVTGVDANSLSGISLYYSLPVFGGSPTYPVAVNDLISGEATIQVDDGQGFPPGDLVTVLARMTFIGSGTTYVDAMKPTTTVAQQSSLSKNRALDLKFVFPPIKMTEASATLTAARFEFTVYSRNLKPVRVLAKSFKAHIVPSTY